MDDVHNGIVQVHGRLAIKEHDHVRLWREWTYAAPRARQIKHCMCECAPSVNVAANELSVKCFMFHASSCLKALKIHFGCTMFWAMQHYFHLDLVITFTCKVQQLGHWLDNCFEIKPNPGPSLLLVQHINIAYGALRFLFSKQKVFQVKKNTSWRDKTYKIAKQLSVAVVFIFVIRLTLLNRYYNEWEMLCVCIIHLIPWQSDFTLVFIEMALPQVQMLSSRCHSYWTNIFTERSSCQFSGIKPTIPSANKAQPGVKQRCCGIHTLLYRSVSQSECWRASFWYSLVDSLY